MDLGLSDQVALVTGAGRGLGRAIALALVAEGARVAAVARSADQLEALSDETSGAAVPFVADLADLDDVRSLPSRVEDRFGRLDVLVNNAGIAPAEEFLRSEAELMTRVLAVNVVAPAELSRRCAEIFVRRARGKIVNIASISGVRGKARLASYSASKGALVRLTEALAAEWARYDIQVNVVAPGAFATEAQRAVLDDPDVLARRTAKIPARRIADPTEVGALVCYLASPLSSFVTGATYVVDGGETAKI